MLRVEWAETGVEWAETGVERAETGVEWAEKGPPLFCDLLSPPSLTLPFSTHLTLPIRPEGQGGFAIRVRQGVRTENFFDAGDVIRPGTMAWRNLGVCRFAFY